MKIFVKIGFISKLQERVLFFPKKKNIHPEIVPRIFFGCQIFALIRLNLMVLFLVLSFHVFSSTCLFRVLCMD